jgi:hypothetical protein
LTLPTAVSEASDGQALGGGHDSLTTAAVEANLEHARTVADRGSAAIRYAPPRHE